MERRAACVVIGDEVLSGKVKDQNGPYLIEKLRGAGVPLARVLTVADDLDEIVWAVRSCRGRFSPIFTSGGIGPTHDDLTVAGVAAALGREVVQEPTIAASVRAHYGARMTPEALRLANVPDGARLLKTQKSWYPIIAVEDVFLLPGVPQLFRMHVDGLVAELVGRPFVLRCIYVSLGETAIAGVLDRVALAHPAVAIGSYPRFDAADYAVKLTIEAQAREPVERALAALLEALPRDGIVRVE